VLLNEQGEPLWEERVEEDGSYKKTDNIRQAFERLKGKTKVRKPLKSLKKTSASLLRNNEKYASLESLFLAFFLQFRCQISGVFVVSPCSMGLGWEVDLRSWCHVFVHEIDIT